MSRLPGIAAVAAVMLLGTTARVFANAPEEHERQHAFTLTGWVRPDVLAAQSRLLIAVVSREMQDGLWLMADGRVRFDASLDTRRYSLSSPLPLRQSVLSHLALVADGPSLTLYVNGVEVAQIPFAPLQQPVPLRVMPGAVADGRAYRRALTAEEISALAGPREVPPLEVVAITPVPDSWRVPGDVQPEVTFSEPLDATSVSSATIQLLDARGVPVSTTVLYDPLRASVTIVPSERLLPTRRYTVFIAGGASNPRVESAFGEPLLASASSSFMTALEGSRIAAGDSHSVAVDDEGRVWTWGNNNLGQLGRSGVTILPGLVGLPATVSGVAAGSHHTLAVANDGRVFAWGSNSAGQLGLGPASPGLVTIPSEVPGLSDIVAVSAGLWTSVALGADGTVWTWGAVRGLGGEFLRFEPARVEGVSEVVAVSTGSTHVLALRRDGTVWAWGGNVQGEVGDGSQAPSEAPRQVPNLSDVGAIATGVFSSYAVDRDFFVHAWGLAEDGATPRLVPAVIDGLSGVRSLAAGQRRAVAALLDGSVWTWGSAVTAAGQDPLRPTRTDGISASQVAAGFTHQLALSPEGVVSAWSSNGSGQLGEGTTSAHAAPVQISEAGLAWKTGRPVFSHQPGTYQTVLAPKVTSASVGAVVRYTEDGTDPTETSRLLDVGGSLSITRSAHVRARAWAPGQPPSDTVDALYTLQPAVPVMTPKGATFSAALFVSIATSPGATIHYTVDGSHPTSASPVYTYPISVAATQTIKAIAVRDGWLPSAVVTEEYRLRLGVLTAPIFSPLPGQFESQAIVTVSAVEGATIVYTTDGSVPTADSSVYTGPLFVSSTTTIRARAYKPDYDDSPVADAAYHITAAAPVLSPSGGTYSAVQQVQASSATASAIVRFTVDGSVPTESSPAFSDPLTIDSPTVLSVRAFDDLLEPSPVVAATFAFQAAQPVFSPGAGIYSADHLITLVSDSGGEIRYTVDGTVPTLASTLYQHAFGLPLGIVTVTARVFRTGWEPSEPLAVTYTIASDTDPPLITATAAPAPGATGWNSGDVIVTFHCSDADSAITFCSPATTVRGEGANIEVAGLARDTVGNAARTIAAVNIDRSKPILSIFAPLDEETLPPDTTLATIRGGAWDLSGVVAISCEGQPANLAPPAFTCTVPLSAGANTVRVVAEDRAGHVAEATLTIHVGGGPPPTSLRFTPARLTMMLGEVRELLVKDDRDRIVPASSWNSSIAGVAGLSGSNGRMTVAALGAGRTEITARLDQLTAVAVIEVLADGISPPPGTVLWGAAEEDRVPLRGSIVPAVPVIGGDAGNGAALFYIDEAAEWSGASLVRPTGVPITVRATTADGREVWRRRFDTSSSVKHTAADRQGGLVIVWNQWYDEAAGVFHADAVQRLDGQTGRVTWEHRPEPAAFLSEVAVHPDGRVFLTEQRIFGESALVAITPDGGVLGWPLPGGRFTREDLGTGLLSGSSQRPARTTHPIVTADDRVLVVAQRNFAHEVVVSQVLEDGLHVTLDPDASISEAEALILRVGEAGLIATAVSGEWSNFRPDDYRLLPDGEGGLLLGHRRVGHVLRFDAGDRFAGAATLATGGSGYSYGAEYVLGDDAAYVLLHGAVDNGLAHWSSSFAFDPRTLAAVASTPLVSQRSAPSYLRLQFAVAGGGLFLAGPETPDGAHAVALGGGYWAAWRDGPALLAGNDVGVADTAWTSPEGDSRRTNAGIQPGIGIFAKGHAVAGVFRHASVRIVPRDQEYWLQRRPDAFVNQDPRGRFFATIGAGTVDGDSTVSCSGVLTSALNRDRDVHADASPLERLVYAAATENQLIEELFLRDAAYADNLEYACVPSSANNTYNSNSFAAGLLRAAAIAEPRFPYWSLWLYPGWARPVPLESFGK